MKWRLLLGIVSAIVAIWGGLPFVVSGVYNAGVAACVCIGLAVLAIVCCPYTETVVASIFHSKHSLRALGITVMAVVAALILLFIAVSVLMICNAVRTAPADTAVTLVIPGAGIKDDRPSLMLYGRLRAAATYLKENPQVPCVVSGGKGRDEICSEAEVMRACLLELGVEADRIYMEMQSANTIENMQYTEQVIRENGLPTQIVIATQEFHQLRCAVFAKKANLNPVGTATCSTPPYLFLCFWVREFIGICRMGVLGY